MRTACEHVLSRGGHVPWFSVDWSPLVKPEIAANSAIPVFNPGLLQHHLRDEDRVRVTSAPPGKVAAVLPEPRLEQLLHAPSLSSGPGHYARPVISREAWCLPEHGGSSFDLLPATVRQALTGRGGGLDLGALAGTYERVLFVYFDAFGWRTCQRHSSHPLVAHADRHGLVRRLTSQFPSTTAAHVTTIHGGGPVGVHGVYEWFVYEPKLDRIIAPLLHSYADDRERDTLLASGLTAGDIYPVGNLYPELRAAGVPSHATLPAEIAGSTSSRILFHGANVHPCATPAQGLARLVVALAQPGYGFAYLPDVDSAMHRLGPDHPDVERLVDEHLDALYDALVDGPIPAGTLVLITADHGMDAIDPSTTVFVNRLWPELATHLKTGADGRPLAPAGSCRDLFLHTRDGHREHVRARLQELLAGKAEVHAVDELIAQGVFGPEVTERLLHRVADLVVLPYAGESVFWSEPGRFEQPYFGQHGGLTPGEIEIPLLAFVT